MVQCNADYETIEVGDNITVWTDSGNSGQDGTVLAIDSKEMLLAAPFGNYQYLYAYVHHITIDQPLPADECLNFNPDTCRGPVELHTTGTSMKAWPRCEHHANERQRSYESSSERYADSDLPPAWLDRYGTGEQWEND